MPDKWVQWVEENMLRGVPPENLMQILRAKGFHPCYNRPLMQKMCIWVLLDDFLREHPNLDLDGLLLDPYLQTWIRGIANRGIDGKVVIDALKGRGIDLEAFHPQYARRVLHNELGTVMETDGKRSVLFDVFVACAKGYLREVQIYLYCGFPVD